MPTPVWSKVTQEVKDYVEEKAVAVDSAAESAADNLTEKAKGSKWTAWILFGVAVAFVIALVL